METYCVNCNKNKAKRKFKVRKTKQNRLILLSNYANCGKKKLTFIINKELR